MAETADIVIIGGGIAGASAAYELARSAKVVLLEAEEHFGHHSTGRSAASFTENYGPPTVRRLAVASRRFLEQPPEGFAEHPLMSPRGAITIAREDQLDALAEALAAARAFVPTMRELAPAEALARVPFLRPDYVAGAIEEPDSREIDVAGLHQGFLTGARRRGARLITKARVGEIARSQGVFTVRSTQAEVSAPILLDAAGAWGDEVARMAGARTIGLVPKRRTALLVAAPPDLPREWPLVDDVSGAFYFKRDAGSIFVSPADATPSAPMDAYPDDLDVAIAVDRFERATTIEVRRVQRSWAGLRTFAPDGVPVAGFDPELEGFVWLAGQGGYGIKTSPALSRLIASLVLDNHFPAELESAGLTPAELAPARLTGPLPA